jgi:UDP-N-acetylmuramate dehydrogenase
MSLEIVVEKLKQKNIRFRLNEELKNHTTLKIGGKTDIFVSVENKEQLVYTLKLLNQYNQKYFVIGSGSNLLISDDGFRGCVIKLTGDFVEIKRMPNYELYTGAGAVLGMVIKYCIDNSLSGLENLFGIPGTIGGAIYMNAGTKDCTISDKLKYVEVINFYDDEYEVSILKKDDEINFEYRKSNLDNCIILGAVFNLSPSEKSFLEKKVTKVLLTRSTTQPLGSFNAGCVFKNPKNYNMSAGMLIEQCGLKGYSIGGAMVSDKHANFIINKNNSSSQDFVKLIKYVMDTVYKKFNIKLELEIKLVNINL